MDNIRQAVLGAASGLHSRGGYNGGAYDVKILNSVAYKADLDEVAVETTDQICEFLEEMLRDEFSSRKIERLINAIKRHING